MTTAHTTDEHGAIRALLHQKATNHGWANAAGHAMTYLTNLGRPFSADDLRDLMGDNQPETPNAIGGLFLSYRQQGLIRRAGIVASKNTRSNGSVVFQWVGAQAS